MNHVETALGHVQGRLKDDCLDRKAVKQLAQLLLCYMNEDCFTELLEQHPYEKRRVDRLEERCRELIVDLHLLLRTPDEAAKKLLNLWISRWRDYQSHEYRLLFDSYNIDLGCPH